MRFRVWMLFMVVVPIVLTATLLTAFFVSDRWSSLEEELYGRGRALARQVAAGSELGLFSGNQQAIEVVAAAALRDPDVDAVVVRDEGGIVMARVGDSVAAIAVVNGGKSTGHIVVSEHVKRSVTPLDDLYATATAPVVSGDLGTVIVVMATDELKKNRVRTVVMSLLVTLGLCVFAVGLVLIYLRRFGLRLSLLSETVARIGNGDLTAQIDDIDSTRRLKVLELDQLSVGIDAMARQINASHRDLAQRVAQATIELEQRRADAERANLAKSRFLAAASHDLRQPLHALGLFADQLSRRDLQGEDGRLVGRIVESSGALSELLDALLDISRLDAGAMTPKFAPVELAPLLRRLRADFENQAEQHGLRLIVHSSEAWVNADPMMLERILINLVSNAIRYTRTGTVLLAVRRSTVGRLRIEVRDSGVGIRHEAQDLIFDEFVQLDNPERDRNKGLGLGLSIVQRMCQLMNCRYGVRSRLGKGSVFWLELPTASAVVALRTESPAAERLLEGCVVAMVEYDERVLDGLQDQLQSWGCEVYAAKSGAKVLADLVRDEMVPEVILCDLNVSGGESGVKVVAQLRAHFGAEIPAVLLAAEGETTRSLSSEDGATDLPVLSKPVRPGRLRAVIQSLLPE